jgi:aspartyl protease family protein
MRRIIFSIVLTLIIGSVQAVKVSVKVIALFADKAYLEIGGKQKIVNIGETFEGVMLKSASGRGAVVVIDGEIIKLQLNQSIGANYKKPDRDSMKIYPNSQGMYFVKGSINGQPTRFLVDTGATLVTMSGQKARALGIDFHRGIRGTAQTAAAVVQVWRITLNTVDIGGIGVRNVDATVIEGKHPSDVLLGNSFLRHTRIQQIGPALEIHKRY